MAKAFAGSYSRLKNFETCPKRHYEIDIAKNYSEPVEPGGPLEWGDRVHKALAAALGKGVPLPDEMLMYQKWVDKVKAWPGDTLLVEQKYAITREFLPTQWFGQNVWWRGIGDVVKVDGALAKVWDWKTGKLLMDNDQLTIMAQCIFSHFPKVRVVVAEYVWLKDDCSTPEIFRRPDVANDWIGLLPRAAAMEEAYRTQEFPPKPGKLCRSWCIITGCPFHGKGFRG